MGGGRTPSAQEPEKEKMMYPKTEEIKTGDAPLVQGLTFRNFRGEEDYPGMLKVYKAAMDFDGIEASDTLEDIASNYQHLVRCDPYKDMVFAEVDGELVAYGRCWWDAELNNDHRYSFFVNLRPEWRGKGIGKAIATSLIERLRTIAEGHPEQAEKFLQGWTSDIQTWQRSLLEGLGFSPIRYGYEMVRPCSQPIDPRPLPEGVEVRPITPDLYRKVWDAEAEAFRDHWGYIEPTEEKYQEWLNWPHLNPKLWKVAWDGDEIVGMVLNFINQDENQEYNRKRGYTEDISVRRPWRRQGIATALLTQSIIMFQEMGMEETCLGVDTENPNGALQLYQSVGYSAFRTWMTYRKPLYEN